MVLQAGDGHRVRERGSAALALGGAARAGAAALPARHAAARAAQQRLQRERAARTGTTTTPYSPTVPTLNRNIAIFIHYRTKVKSWKSRSKSSCNPRLAELIETE